MFRTLSCTVTLVYVSAGLLDVHHGISGFCANHLVSDEGFTSC